MAEYFLLIFGLGFFIYVVWIVQVAEERQYQRRLNEKREFGVRSQETTSKDTRKK